MWIAQMTPGFDQLASLGAAGLMGAMWLWERLTSRHREEQLDDAHTRILSDRIEIGLLVDVVKQNAEAMTRLSATQEQLLRQISGRAG